MDDLDDVIVSFDSVLQKQTDGLHAEIFQLDDQVRAELTSGMEALSEARQAANENRASLEKIFAHLQDRTWLDRTLAQFRALDDEMNTRNKEYEASVVARIGELKREMKSRSLLPAHRERLKASLDLNRDLLKRSKKRMKSYLATRKGPDQFAEALHSVQKLPGADRHFVSL